MMTAYTDNLILNSNFVNRPVASDQQIKIYEQVHTLFTPFNMLHYLVIRHPSHLLQSQHNISPV